VDCRDQRWSSKPRDYNHVLSTTPTPMTPRPPTTPRDLVVTSTAAARRSQNDDVHVTYDQDGDWSRGKTLERPPVYINEDDGDNARTRTEADDLNTVRHWLKYGEVSAGPPVYRELVDDEDDDLDDVHDDFIHGHRVDRPSDAVVHVHHVHEVNDHAVSVVDAEAAKTSALATVALEDDGLEPATQRPSSDDEPLHNDNSRSGAGDVRKYNVEEGQT